MATEIRTLKDGITDVLPRTVAKAVHTSSGSTIDIELEKFQSNIKTKVDKKIPSIAGNLASLDIEGNLLDSGKAVDDFAPSGFGLGENCRIITDWNTATASGWYRNTTYDPNNNSPDNFAWYGFVIVYFGELLVQVAYHANSKNVILEARRCCYSGVWGEWEWITPALQPGIEYRLAELYNGKPVYATLRNCGKFAAAGTPKTVSFDVPDIKYLVSSSFDFDGWNVPTNLYGGAYDESAIVLAEARAVSTGKLDIVMYAKSRDLTNDGDVLAYIKYTKTTD